MERYLQTLDFDQTIANTFEASPNGIGVIKAYDNAIGSVFGNRGLEVYKKLGGLRNQSPDQVVESILKESDENLEPAVNQFLDEHMLRLLSLIPSKKIKEEIKNRELNNKIITELVIAEKLSNFFCEIGNELPDGQIWPKLCKGFSSFYKTMEKINSDENNIDITMAIVSSGHKAFIEKTFGIHNLKAPKIIITTDTMREIENPLSEDRSKPNPFTFNLAYKEWLREKGIEEEESLLEKMIYFGDDLKKDGGLAKNCGILFGHFDPESHYNQQLSQNRFSFSDWGEVGQILEQNIELLSRGESFSNVFFEK